MESLADIRLLHAEPGDEKMEILCGNSAAIARSSALYADVLSFESVQTIVSENTLLLDRIIWCIEEVDRRYVDVIRTPVRALLLLAQRILEIFDPAKGHREDSTLLIDFLRIPSYSSDQKRKQFFSNIPQSKEEVEQRRGFPRYHIPLAHWEPLRRLFLSTLRNTSSAGLQSEIFPCNMKRPNNTTLEYTAMDDWMESRNRLALIHCLCRDIDEYPSPLRESAAERMQTYLLTGSVPPLDEKTLPDSSSDQLLLTVQRASIREKRERAFRAKMLACACHLIRQPESCLEIETVSKSLVGYSWSLSCVLESVFIRQQQTCSFSVSSRFSILRVLARTIAVLKYRRKFLSVERCFLLERHFHLFAGHRVERKGNRISLDPKLYPLQLFLPSMNVAYQTRFKQFLKEFRDPNFVRQSMRQDSRFPLWRLHRMSLCKARYNFKEMTDFFNGFLSYRLSQVELALGRKTDVIQSALERYTNFFRASDPVFLNRLSQKIEIENRRRLRGAVYALALHLRSRMYAVHTTLTDGEKAANNSRN